MTLFGALSSGVSGLSAQSSAMGAISDNITNVSTIGYKNTQVDFQTLVTAQTSATFFSAGGVQSRPRQDTGVQGLLQASASQTDISISGSGYFVVNEAARPTINNEFLYTRAGSFFQDNEGFLRNTAGFYLQAWPTDAQGNVKPANDSLTVPNQNVISTDFLETINLNRVGGTATATSNIAIGANLPSNDAAGVTHKTDVQFFDTLGNANTMSVVYTKSPTDNQWDVTIEPPTGTAALTLETSAASGALAYRSIGQLEFTARANEGSTVVVDGITYEFDTNGIFADTTTQETATKKFWDASSNTSVSEDVADLINAIQQKDSDFNSVFGRVAVSASNSSTILFADDGTDDIVVNPAGLLNSVGSPVVKQTGSFTVNKTADQFSSYRQFHFPFNPSTGNTILINSIQYEFVSAGGSVTGTADRAITVSGTSGSTVNSSIAATLANLETAVEAQDPEFAGDAVRLRGSNQDSSATIANDTVVFKSKDNGTTYTVDMTGLTATVQTVAKTPADITAAVTVSTTRAIVFNSDGIPTTFNVAEIEIKDFQNGASDMDDGSNSASQITLDFGNVGEANGLTQFGSSFTPVFITQNGSQFGTFAGVTVGTDGLVTALFDNGETRPVYKLPIATFVNVNSLGSRTGNVWNATEASGDATLREADNGPAGQVIQAALEQSTVDIGTEFTKMIVVQRAFSAAAKIISTADEMLEELLRTKR